MMRGKSAMATAVRDADGIIRVESVRITPTEKQKKILRFPVIRGVVSFVSSFVTGMKTLMRSLAEKILCLPDSVRVYPGHQEDTTIGEERLCNPYFREC